MAMEAINNLGVYQSVQPIVQPIANRPQTERQDAQQAQDAAQQSQAPAGDLTVAPVQEAGKQQGGDEKGGLNEQQQEAQNERIKEAISKLNKNINGNEEAVFGIHEGTNRVTIKMVDKDTKKVVKEFPPDKTLDMIAKVWELAGIMVDEKR
ncbi:MAG: flagellar protein FlaG [Lachnospiraceae bacterium]|jgi:flagellar protein FlaG|nr:flagellar protein FlaG [Lachnospiraceae bacterium]